MDKATVFGTVDGGSIPSEGTSKKTPRACRRVFFWCYTTNTRSLVARERGLVCHHQLTKNSSLFRKLSKTFSPVTEKNSSKNFPLKDVFLIQWVTPGHGLRVWYKFAKKYTLISSRAILRSRICYHPALGSNELRELFFVFSDKFTGDCPPLWASSSVTILPIAW